MQRLASGSFPRLAGPGPLLYKAPSKVGVWLSLVEHCVRDAGVAGSNPATPTKSVSGVLPAFPDTCKAGKAPPSVWNPAKPPWRCKEETRIIPLAGLP